MLLPSVHLDQIVSQFSQAMISAISTPHHYQKIVRNILLNLTRMKNRPSQLTMEVYEWCSAVCENGSSLADKADLLLPSLKLGFRHLNFKDYRIQNRDYRIQIKDRSIKIKATDMIHIKVTHMNHQKIAEIVFESGDNETFADLLHAWLLCPQEPPPTVIEMWAQHLIGLQKLQPFSPRLRQLIIHSITFIGGCQAPKLVEVEEFVGFLNNLCVGVEEIMGGHDWGLLLLHVTISPFWPCFWPSSFLFYAPSSRVTQSHSARKNKNIT
jgi:hypothetical protein